MPLSPRHIRMRAVAGMASVLLVGASFAVTGCSQGSQSAAPASTSSTQAVASSTAESTPAPNLIGLTETAATDKLETLGLKASIKQKVVSDANQVGVVTAQRPPEGTRLAPGDTVTIAVGKKKPESTSGDGSKKASASSISFPSTASAASVANKMDAKDTDYDASGLSKKYRPYYDRGTAAVGTGDYRGLATNVAALYDAYPSAAQSLVNDAKSEKWYGKFKKQLLKRDAGAEDLLDLD